jgi:hypothetical protein
MSTEKKGWDAELYVMQVRIGCMTCEYADKELMGYANACLHEEGVNVNGLFKCKNHNKKN